MNHPVIVGMTGWTDDMKAKVLSGEITVNEALVTGESDEITKKQNADLLSGSFVISGKCLARWFNPRTGDYSFIGLFDTSAPQTFTPPTPGELLDWILVLTVP